MDYVEESYVEVFTVKLMYDVPEKTDFTVNYLISSSKKKVFYRLFFCIKSQLYVIWDQ